jgi:hypothetical protein
MITFYIPFQYVQCVFPGSLFARKSSGVMLSAFTDKSRCRCGIVHCFHFYILQFTQKIFALTNRLQLGIDRVDIALFRFRECHQMQLYAEFHFTNDKEFVP